MALKLTIDDLVEVPGNLRGDYKKGADGKYHLVTEGEHPDTAELAKVKAQLTETTNKLNDFRENGRASFKAKTELEEKLKAFEGIDPDEYRALKSRPDTSKRVTELEAALATEKAAHADAQKQADSIALRTTVADAFHRAGGRAEAADFIFAKAKEVFALENGTVTSKAFSTDRPGEPLTVDEWVSQQILTSAFAFKPSGGGGASGNKGGSGGGKRTISGGDPLEFGKNIEGIAKGEVTVSS